MTGGYAYFADRLAAIDDARLAEPSALPDWSRKHIVAHLGFNARALGRLVHWAKSGVETRMYADETARAEEIAAGATWSGARLRDFVSAEQGALVEALSGLSDANWSAQVVTGQGRSVPATEIPWLRTRELWIHSVDLGTEGDFDDFPPEMIDKLVTEVAAKRRAGESPTLEVRPTGRPAGRPVGRSPIEGRASDLASWLTGRGDRGVRTSPGAPLPELGPWL
jgi:maleylpyruvate isomerase